MKHHDPKRQFAVDVVRRLHDAGFQALWAGGCVRDFLLGREPGDYDVATDARPEEVRKLFGYRKTHPVGVSFGVVLVVGSPEKGNIEVATFRTEGEYLDGRRPEKVVYSTPEEDAQRRDFTINGMFYDPLEHHVLDYVGGEHDLGECVIRAIGNPHERMTEDKLRMLRAVRFSATLDFRLDDATRDAVRDMSHEIQVVSAERITQEMKRMLLDPHRVRALELCRETGLMKWVLPELTDILPACSDPEELPTQEAPHGEWGVILKAMQHLSDPSFELSMAILLHHFEADNPGHTAQTCRRFKLSNLEADAICWLVENQTALDEAAKLSLADLKRLMVHPLIDDLIAMVRALKLSRNEDLDQVAFCEDFLEATPAEELAPPPLVDGNDVMGWQVPGGPNVKFILDTVRTAQLNNEIRSKDDAHRLIESLIAAEPSLLQDDRKS